MRDRLSWCIFVLAFTLCLGQVVGCGPLKPAAFNEGDVLRGVTQLTFPRDFVDATEPALSHDGKWIAFRGIATGETMPRVFVAPLNDLGNTPHLGTPVAVTPKDARSSSPNFTDDGLTLLLASTAGSPDDPFDTDAPARYRVDAASDLFRVDGWQRNVTTAMGDGDSIDLAKHRLAPADGFDGHPASRGSRWVVFTSDRGGARTALDRHDLVNLWLLNLDGGQPRRLVDDVGFDGQPTWHPTEPMIVFISDRGLGRRPTLHRLTLQFDETGFAAATRSQPLDINRLAADPVFHPSGRFLVYVDTTTQAADGNAELRQVRVDGTRDFRLTFSPAADESPTFDSAGKHLVWASRRTPDGTRQLYIANFKTLRRS